jgi:hypothetical protein
VAISVGVHLFFLAVLLLGSLWFHSETVSAISPDDDINVEVVHLQPGKADRRDQDRNRTLEPKAQETAKEVTARGGKGRSPAARRSGATKDARGELPVCTPLSMRACRQPEKKKREVDRLISFWGGVPKAARPRAPRIISRVEVNGVVVTRYADGGKLFSSTRGGQRRPDLGTVGLVDLARGRVGGRSGRTACNPYRLRLRGKRTLVLLVDTSASVEATGSSSKAVHCAAGAALAALRRGYPVEVLNFSTTALHQPPTRDAEQIYRTLSFIQKKHTWLPPASRLVSSSARPRDFVLVTDSAIGNLEQTLPTYTQAVKTHADNRAMLYLLGNGVVCPRCHFSRNEICYSCSKSSRETLVALEKAGFSPHYLERPPPRTAEIAAREILRWMLH